MLSKHTRSPLQPRTNLHAMRRVPPGAPSGAPSNVTSENAAPHTAPGNAANIAANISANAPRRAALKPVGAPVGSTPLKNAALGPRRAALKPTSSSAATPHKTSAVAQRAPLALRPGAPLAPRTGGPSRRALGDITNAGHARAAARRRAPRPRRAVPRDPSGLVEHPEFLPAPLSPQRRTSSPRLELHLFTPPDDIDVPFAFFTLPPPLAAAKPPTISPQADFPSPPPLFSADELIGDDIDELVLA